MVRRGFTSRSGRPICRRSVENILQNPFYCGMMRNGRTGELFEGIHEPLITSTQFQRIADIKTGRHVKKHIRHDYLLRRLFSCALCNRSLTPERQKGHVYYRCHTAGCGTKTIREELLDVAVREALDSLQLTDADDAKLERRYRNWRALQGFRAELKSVDLRVESAQAKLDRLTDLLIDGHIDKLTHDRKKERLLHELGALREERQEIKYRTASDRDRRKFFELMKTLGPLYKTANPPERRILVENCFSNRRWNGKYVELQPSELILEAQDGLCVPYGGAIRVTLRTLIEQLDKSHHKEQTDEAV